MTTRCRRAALADAAITDADYETSASNLRLMSIACEGAAVRLAIKERSCLVETAEAIELYLGSVPLDDPVRFLSRSRKPRHPLALAREDIYVAEYLQCPKVTMGGMLVDTPSKEFALAGSLEELKIKGRLAVHGGHRPILVIYDRGRVFALDNRCPHMGFPLERGSVEDGILTCHWHHARFDLESGCTFDLWADDVPTCPVEVRNGDVWVKTTFTDADPAVHWHQRLANGLVHDLSLVIAKAVHGQLAAGVAQAEIVRQVALFGAQNRDGWGVGLTILTALANLLSALPEDEAYLALFHGARHVATDCDGAAPRRERAPLGSQPQLAALKRWLRRWTNVRHREAAERTLLTMIAAGFSPAELADALFAAATERAFADTGHSLDFINKAFECLELVGWGTRSGSAADCRRSDGRGPWRRGINGLAPAR
ncbi:Rieske (2Fe-2S) protein [Bradyrhizobium sp. LB11.1]|uniref:Rieske (2Fe-2S) protein n=1 Tax=Bradyrhizobium sp. LB11.1 TaxID=3156326 RepID=UPI003394A0ED